MLVSDDLENKRYVDFVCRVFWYIHNVPAVNTERLMQGRV